MKKGAMMDFSDHTVLVTGAATGIGFGISEAFHAAGARVALGDLDGAGLARAAAHYCASKAGVVMFTKVLAMEMGPHRINVNCIAPGLVTVDRDVTQVSEEYVKTLVSNIPWGRAGTPADIARAALFLASADADFITGEVLSVDGGSGTGRTYLPYSRKTS